MKKDSIFGNLYKLYTEDLGKDDLERLIKNEAPEVYSFYLESVKTKDYQSKNRFERVFLFTRDLVVVFLRKLSPIRRIIFSGAFIIFFYSYLIESWFYASGSFLTMVLLLAFELAGKLSATSELDMAAKIQTDTTICIDPVIEGYEIAPYSKPARVVGGDFLNCYKLKGNQLSTIFLMGDVSGKGLAAALYMVQVHALMSYLSTVYDDVKSIVKNLDQMLNRIFQAKYFFTATGLKIDLGNDPSKVEVFRAGHSPLIIYTHSNAQAEFIVPGGIGLGLRNSKVFDRTLKTESMYLKPGDILIFFTDGVNESINYLKEEYGTERLKKIVQTNANLPAKEILSKILKSIEGFTGSTPARDDLTLLIVKKL